MRPVNLIPPEDRRGDRAPLRKGSLSYAIVAGLAAALVGVTVVVLTNNSISDREAEIASLEVREDAARKQAESRAAFAEFSTVSQARQTTVSSLAQSRFDWYRILQELALVIPDDVSLTSLKGSITPETSVGEGTSALREGSAGPALSMAGCAEGHEAVAAFLQDLRDIDGVTRVGVENSTIGEQGGGAGSGASTGCPPGGKLAEFSLVAVFDGVSVPQAGAAPTSPPTTTTGAAPPPADSSIAGARAQQQEARHSVERQSNEADEATKLIPGVAR